MTDRAALIALRDAVVAGYFPADMSGRDIGISPLSIMGVYDAFSGSVDAAIALLKAVLPGSSFWVETKTDGTHHAGVFVGNLGKTFQAKARSLSCALLIATLNALIAKEKE